KKRFAAVRTKYLTQQVAEQVRRGVQVVAEKKAADTSVSLQAARDFAENEMAEELFGRAAQALRIELDEVKEMWSQRAKYPVGKRSEHFAYGLGSWILGEQGVIKDTAVAQAQNKQQQVEKAPENSRDVERVQRALKQMLERRRAAAQGGAAGEERE